VLKEKREVNEMESKKAPVMFICGGEHSRITTRKQWREHIKEFADDPFGCMDCWAGIPPAYAWPQRKKRSNHP
jgi:hypothetical protein